MSQVKASDKSSLPATTILGSWAWYLHFSLNRQSGMILPRSVIGEATLLTLRNINRPQRVFAPPAPDPGGLGRLTGGLYQAIAPARRGDRPVALGLDYCPPPIAFQRQGPLPQASVRGKFRVLSHFVSQTGGETKAARES